MKKLFTILALLMAFTVSGVAQKTVYLKPNSNWLEDDARFAVYMFTSEANAWTDFSAMGESGIYSATIPEEYADGKIILVRMNGTTTENNWNNKWNQSPDITTVNANAFYIITGWDTYRESSIPSLAGTPIWSSDAPVAVVNWNGPITISAEKFSNAKVGDIIHVGVEGVTTTADWDAQVSIRNGQTWGGLEQDFPVGNGTVIDAWFVITGDLLGILKENGLLLTGKQYVSRLVTLESVEGTYSDKAIWIGNKTGSFTVNKNHLINANIEAGNVIRVTATPTQGHSGGSWLTMQYDNNGWNDFENASSFQTSTGYELLLTDDMCNILRDYNLVINENGYTVTQVEIISESAINQIESVQIRGDWNEWSGEAGALTKVEGSNTWKGTIDLSNVSSDQEFKVVIDFTNMDDVYWYGRRQMPIADDGTADVVTIQTENDNVWDNFVLKNETSGYQTYDVTLTWNDSACPYAGWTLAIAPEEARPKTTFTATFVNGAGWENVYAYIWKAGVDNNVELNGPFPGVQLVKTGTTTINTVEYDVYTFTFETYEDESTVPEMIIFSDGTDTNKTEDLDFEEGKEYTETVPHEDYYVIGNNGTKWVALGKMDYLATMNEYNYNLDETWTGKYFAIAPASALNGDGDVVEWSKVVRPNSEGNFLVELRNYYDDVVTGGENVWEKTDEITRLSIHYYIDVQDFALYPESDVTISDAGYATYSNKFDYFTFDAKVSIVKNVEGNKAVLEELEFLDGANKGISGGTGVILEKVFAETDVVTIYPYDKEEYNEYVDVTGNMLIGSGNYTYNITGEYPGGGNYTAYILAKKDNGVGFYLFDDSAGIDIPAHKAFLAVPGTNAAPFFGFADAETTGINSLTPTLSAGEGVYYTLDGRRVENPTKGLYIVNGKKVLVP